MYYKVKLAKELTRTIVIKANNEDDAIDKIWSKGLDSKYICPESSLYDFTFDAYDNGLNQDDRGWIHLSHETYPDDDKLIRCTADLLGMYRCETIEQMNHELFKRMSLELIIKPMDDNQGVIITGNIIKGYHYNEPYETLYFPFFKSEYYDALYDVGNRTTATWDNFYSAGSGTPWEHTEESTSDGVRNLRVMFPNADYNNLTYELDELVKQKVIADYMYIP